MSFSGMGDLKAAWEQKNRREEMAEARKEDLSKFRQMLCAVSDPRDKVAPQKQVFLFYFFPG